MTAALANVRLPEPTANSQATAIEQTRAIAEVQAMVTVAQRIPRDISRAIGNAADSCGRMGLAQRAFYSVPNRGNGPSVHLARELARIWGNIQYGVHELSRNDDIGESEVQAFAWDLETNTRSTRTFIVPHARMKSGKRVPLTDLNDIYLSNQNVGARAVRECIFTVLPTWFTDEAQDQCRKTLEKGEGKPLPQRISDMVKVYSAIGITAAQLEHRIGRKQGSWDAGDVAQMAITYTSITRDHVDKDEFFPVAPVSAAEITGAAATPPAAAPAPATPERDPDVEWITDAQLKKIHACLSDLGITDREGRLAYLSKEAARPITTSKDVTKAEARIIIDVLEKQTADIPDPEPQES